jgi:DNA-binding beta-propeller fold protein YncE
MGFSKFSLLSSVAAATLLAACGSSTSVSGGEGAGGGVLSGRCGGSVPVAAATQIPNNGRTLRPYGRMTTVGNLPTGGALTPDGRFYWSVSAGDGRNDVRIVDVASGAVVQVLPMPGTYGQMAFSPDGATAYVSGEPNSTAWKPAGPTMADAGGAIHVFKVDPLSGMATEQAPIMLSAGASGWPTGIGVSPDGKTLVVALYHANKAAIIDAVKGQESSEISVGTYPFAARFERSGKYAYVSNAQDGSLSKIDPVAGKVVSTIAGMGGSSGDYNSQPQYLLADPKADRLYVAVTNHDGVAVLNTKADQVERFISLKRPEGYGAAPTALALAPDGNTLYVANAGENAITAIALSDRANGGAKAWSVIGKIPTADYTQDVAVTPDSCTLVWTAARGLGAGPNPDYGLSWENSYGAPYGSYVPDKLIGRVGILPLPGDAGFAAAMPTVEASIVPGDGSGRPTDAPAGTPIVGANGGPSDRIKYVFFVVRENRTYDQIFGSVPRGDGDPNLQVAEDNCGAQNTAFEGADRKHPGCGTTPNAHALSRKFLLLDRFFEDSEVSVDGHMITSSSYANNALTKAVPANYTGRNTSSDTSSAIALPPLGLIFDQAVRQNLTFRNYGESTAFLPPDSQDRASTFVQVAANSDLAYLAGVATAASFACASFKSVPGYPNLPTCTFDSGMGHPPALAGSHIDEFNLQFQAQLLAGTVPHLNYLAMPDDHTNGTGVGLIQPLSEVADNDLGLGQLVQLVSHSSIWPQSVIFVVEDDSQDGADHYEAHRAPAFVISPWARHDGVLVHTHYDQYSVLRTIELILGLKPLSIYDANAVPMYDAFSATPDNSSYDAITPERSLTALNPANAANAALSAALPFDREDAVPQELADRILWQSVFGPGSEPPPPGPHASQREHLRTMAAVQAYREGRDVRAALRALGDND